jgi:glycosyltransferase involved in cell wall biosynthesis
LILSLLRLQLKLDKKNVRQLMKSRLTIALCLEYPLGQMGGLEILLQELILGLSDNFDLILVSADRGLGQCPALFQPRLKAHFYWNYKEASPTKARTLAEDLSKAGVDLVHFHLGGNYAWETHKFWQSPIYYCRHVRLPYLLTTHSVFPIFEGYSNPARSVLVKALILPKAWLSRALILLGTSCEVTVSQQNQRRIKHLFPFWSKRFRQLYHSRLSLMDIEETQTHDSANREKVIACAATIGRIKGQLILARAFARLAPRFPEWSLELMGRVDDMNYQKQIGEVAASLSDPGQIQFVGVIHDFKVLRDRLRRTALYVQPSLVEGLGLAVQEALAFGCPAVGSDVGGIPEMIESGVNGLLVPPGNEEALAEALEQLMRDEALRHRLSQAAPREMLRRRITREDMLSQYTELYHSLLATA